MMMRILPAAALICAASADGAFNAGMFSSANPATYGTQIAQLDVTPGNYNFPFPGSFTNSGYVDEFGSIILDRTELSTRVYRVTTPTSFGAGSLTLNPNDLVFAYTIRLVQESTNTVQTMSEFQVGLLSFVGGNIMDGSAILGRGFVTPGPGVATPLGGNANDLSIVGPFGSSHDWQWSSNSAQQLDNSQTITLLMFSSPRPIAEGFGNFFADPGQQAGVAPTAEGAPVLIPIVPTPGAGAVLALAAAFGLPRRRR